MQPRREEGFLWAETAPALLRQKPRKTRGGGGRHVLASHSSWWECPLSKGPFLTLQTCRRDDNPDSRTFFSDPGTGSGRSA